MSLLTRNGPLLTSGGGRIWPCSTGWGMAQVHPPGYTLPPPADVMYETEIGVLGEADLASRPG